MSSVRPIPRAESIGLSILIVLALPTAAWAQARLVLNNNAWLRIDNGAWVVIGNPDPTGIQTLGTGGNIRSEGEFNRIRWNIRGTTNIYTVPFTTAGGVKMPLTYEVTTAGDNGANASIGFSTYNYGTVGATNWNNNLYRPSDVTHMNNLSTSLDNSDYVVDRFWIIDPGMSGYAYTTKPDVRLGFTFDPGAATGEIRTGNSFTAASTVLAQRFNPGTNQWGDMPAQGTFTAGPTNSVTNANIPAAAFFRSWTLSELTHPLPIELARFDATCAGSTVDLRWSTASEIGNSHFIPQRSSDGSLFQDLARIEAVGNSQTLTNYAFEDASPIEQAYYRLAQVDLDGSVNYSPMVVGGCSGAGISEIVSAWQVDGDIVVLFSIPGEQQRGLALYDASGKLILSRSWGSTSGLNTIRIPREDLAPGIYVVRSSGPDRTLVRRVSVQ
ncbi:MAG: T9SS type A sorting domain-containing protein [Flavobacteriales bacterium]|nr:T9SS type A sorting domain-containing protein [Flavobacteriales bacterium]